MAIAQFLHGLQHPIAASRTAGAPTRAGQHCEATNDPKFDACPNVLRLVEQRSSSGRAAGKRLNRACERSSVRER
jgi:hypothetical protein